MAATMVSSAGGLLAMLNEPHPSLKFHALSNLNAHVDRFWPEISTSVPIIESLYEDEGFDQKQRQLAALVVSKCFYYLGEHNDSLSYALGAGSLFDVSEDSDYVHTLLAKAIDEYASLRTKAAESKESADVDPRLEAIVERMLNKCITQMRPEQPKPLETDVAQSGNTSVSEDTQMAEETEAPVAVVQESDPAEVTYAERLTKMKGILSGETSMKLTLQFLYTVTTSRIFLFLRLSSNRSR